MKILSLLGIAILITGSVILLYSTANFELAEQHFENQRNGLECDKLGSGCPYPDFSGPMFYGINGLAVFAVGAILSVSKNKTMLTKLVLGITSVVSGMPSVVFSIFAYADDYNHYELIIKKCPSVPCMYPNIFANIKYVQFFGIYGGILLMMGIIILVMYFGKNKK